MGLRFSVLGLVALFSTTSLFAFPNPKNILKPAKPILSSIKTADDSIVHLHVSNKYESSKAPKAMGGVDLVGYEHTLIQEQLKLDTPAKNKKLVLVRYEIADDRIVEDLIAAKNAGYGEVLIVTDLNISLKGIFEPGEKLNTNFERAAFRDSPVAIATAKLLKAGFKYNDPKYGIFSQPIYDDNPKVNARVPIMHEKELILVTARPGKEDLLTAVYGTANMVGTHYNRHMVVSDRDVAKQFLDHAYLLRDNFAKKDKEARISEVTALQPIRVFYGDGSADISAGESEQDRSFEELQFTDGRHNPNERISALFKNAVDKKITIDEVTFSEFVLTNSGVVESLRDAMTAQRGFKVFGVFDDKFIDIHAFGLAGELDGFPINRPMGHAMLGYDPDLAERTMLYAYQRQRRNEKGLVLEEDPEGKPNARFLWHDKTTIVSATDAQKREWDYIFTGSFNNSNNDANAEAQMMYRFKRNSPMAIAFKESVRKVAEAESKAPPEGDKVVPVLPLPEAIVRNGIARFAGVSVFQVPPTVAAEIYAKLKAGEYAKLAEYGDELKKIKSTLAPKLRVSVAELERRFAKLTSFAEWYRGLKIDKDFKQGDFLPAEKLTAAALILSYPRDKPLTKRNGLEALLITPAYTKPENKEKFVELVKAAWKELGMTGELPEPEPKKKD